MHRNEPIALPISWVSPSYKDHEICFVSNQYTTSVAAEVVGLDVMVAAERVVVMAAVLGESVAAEVGLDVMVAAERVVVMAVVLGESVAAEVGLDVMVAAERVVVMAVVVGGSVAAEVVGLDVTVGAAIMAAVVGDL